MFKLRNFCYIPVFCSNQKHIDNCQQSKLTRIPGANENVTFDMECDFIDEQMETVTFTQPFLVLKRCQIKQHKQTKRKSPLVASKKFSRIIKLEKTTDCNIKYDKAWNLGNNQEDNFEPTSNKVKIYNTPKVRFNCDICTARYKTKALLERHKTSVHTGKTGETFTCPICSRVKKRRNGVTGLHAHLDQHENAEALEIKFNLWKQWATKPNKKNQAKTFSCKYCFTPIRNHRSFLCHMATDHPDKGEHSTYHCPYNCSTQLNSIKEYIAHFKSAHPEEYLGSPMGEFIIVKGRRRIKCEICEKFIDSRNMAAHMTTTTHLKKKSSLKKKGKHACPYPGCEIKCSTIELLKRHFVYHLENNPYVCNFPGCSTKADAPCHLLRHMKHQHLDAPPICPKCGVTYISRCKLKNHKCQDNIDKVKSGKYKLVEIGGSRKLKPSNSSNEDTKLPLDPRYISTPRLVKYDPTDKVDQYIESLKQIDIDALIRSDPGFIQACKVNPGLKDLILGVDYISRKFRPYQKRRSKVYKCTKCPTMFTRLNGYMKHKSCCKGSDGAAVGSGKPLRIGCELCGNPFGNEAALEKHLGEDHSPDEVFRCDAPGCAKYYSSADGRRGHFQRFHQPYQCGICRTSLANQTNLDLHLEQHRLDPSFGVNQTPPCELCGKVLFNLTNHRQHMQRIHGITLPVPLPVVPGRPKPKKDKHSSKGHTSNNLFKCDEPGCNRYFSAVRFKRRHIQLIHTHRPYRCAKCKERFLSQARLDQHLEYHRLNPSSRTKTPPCEVCGNVFAHFHSYKRHMQNVHGITTSISGGKFQSTPKKTIVKETVKTHNEDKIKIEVAEYPQNDVNLVVPVKIEPELTIESDAIKCERHDVDMTTITLETSRHINASYEGL